jgi:signal transduction histidine kinase
MKRLLHQLNIVGQCRELNISIWSCPRFLFVIMGAVIITSIIVTYEVGQHYVTPDAVIFSVTLLTIVLLIITNIIVSAFEEVVFARRREIDRAKEVLTLRDQFVYVAVHHLRSAGTAIKWGLKLLEGMDEQGKAARDLVITQMRSKNDTLLRLAKNILLVTQIDAGTLKLAPSAVSLTEAIETARKEEAEELLTHKAEISVTIPDDLPPVFADQVYLAEIMTILFSNAIRHGDKERGVITINALQTEKGSIAFSIENNGPGIPTEEARYVFEQYWRNSGPGRSEGAGLPLYIVRRLAELMGGHVFFSSVPGKTIFSLTLPAAPKTP